MIVEENFLNYVRHYSDQGVMIKQSLTNNLYSEAIDRIGSNFTYTETDVPISDMTYLEKFSIADKIIGLQNEVNTLQEANDMLTECLLEMSEAVYE